MQTNDKQLVHTPTGVSVDLTKASEAKRRIPEVAFVTPGKAPELLAVFNDAYADISRQIPVVEYHIQRAQATANRIRSVVLLDKAPKILQEKNLTTSRSPGGSEDLRTAVLDADEEYLAACDNVYQLKCILDTLKFLLKDVEMAYSSVKKILGEGSFNYSNNLGSTMPDRNVGDPGEKEASAAFFGKAKY